jgi:cytochrome c oxidase cbb3-type subunit 3
MIQNILKKISLCLFAFVTPLFLFGQAVNTGNVTNQGGGVELNIILLIVAVFLLLPIYITGKSFILLVSHYVKKDKTKSDAVKKTGVLIFLLCGTQLLQAQSTATGISFGPNNWETSILLTVIVIETLLIILFSWLINLFIKLSSDTNITTVVETPVIEKKPVNWFKNIWEKMNRFKPIEEEASIDTGHSYDGIRELDNVTPPWFITAFAITIVIAMIYLYTHHISKSAPLQAEEYNIEMQNAALEKAKFLSSQTSNVDENTVKLLGASEISAGKALFSQKCTPCHGPQGGSKPGGVGPNLTDEYWIHGGSLSNIFTSIKYGWTEKGMIAWKDQLTPEQIAQLANFVKSIRGSNPPGAKDPQGEFYKEESVVKPDSTIKDTTNKNLTAPKSVKLKK